MRQFKLIKRYPSISKAMPIGFIMYKNEKLCNYSNLQHGFPALSLDEVENNPEFWEEIKEKEWEIIQEYHGIVTLQFNCIPSRQIISVKRLSDNTIFSLEDKIKMIGHANNQAPESITKIELNKEGTPCLFTNTFHNNGINIFKAVKYAEIHTTEDGVKIYKLNHPRLYWVQLNHFNLGIDYENSLENIDTDNYKYFSTEIAAKEWIEMNQPKYSRKDIILALEKVGCVNINHVIYSL